MHEIIKTQDMGMIQPDLVINSYPNLDQSETITCI